MNKKENLEYTDTNRHANKRRDKPMLVMDRNIVHDMEYTFADEYYRDLRDEYYENLMSELKDEDE